MRRSTGGAAGDAGAVDVGTIRLIVRDVLVVATAAEGEVGLLVLVAGVQDVAESLAVGLGELLLEVLEGGGFLAAAGGAARELVPTKAAAALAARLVSISGAPAGPADLGGAGFFFAAGAAAAGADFFLAAGCEDDEDVCFLAMGVSILFRVIGGTTARHYITLTRGRERHSGSSHTIGVITSRIWSLPETFAQAQRKFLGGIGERRLRCLSRKRRPYSFQVSS